MVRLGETFGNPIRTPPEVRSATRTGVRGNGNSMAEGMDARPVGISAVLPAYNEEAVIAQTVRHVANVLRDLTPAFEIVTTDDGSRDNTAQVLADLQAAHPELHLRVVRHERNLGYGAALASGFDASTMDLVFFTDGDK